MMAKKYELIRLNKSKYSRWNAVIKIDGKLEFSPYIEHIADHPFQALEKIIALANSALEAKKVLNGKLRQGETMHELVYRAQRMLDGE